MNKLKLGDIFPEFEEVETVNEFTKNIKENMDFKSAINLDLYELVNNDLDLDDLLITLIIRKLKYKGLSDILGTDTFIVDADFVDTKFKTIDIKIELLKPLDIDSEELEDKTDKYFKDYFNNDYEINSYITWR